MQVALENTTKQLCVIGDPVLHSRSPLIQNTMISALGLDYIYLCQPVAAGELNAWLDAAKTTGYVGFNATMPHKEALVPRMDELDEYAARCGAVNTVCIRDGRFYGYNTDGPGFLRALSGAGFHPHGKRIALTGAGGAAKAVAVALVQAGASRVTVCNRSIEKTETLCALDPTVLQPAGLDLESLSAVAAESDLWVNCTSLGMEGCGAFDSLDFVARLPAGVVVCDLIYNPPETALLARARTRGHVVMNGLPMLIHQGILALEHFTETEIDAETMAVLLKEVL